ncbi:MAG: type I methionyl aminopeptidase [Proteobacteria bacterium]|nr:type I methionyl aminopeptidase [Pseudomonadota bacterium]
MKKARGIFLKNEKEIGLMREAGRIVSLILDEIGQAVKPGVPTMLFEDIARKMCDQFKVRPAFLGYLGFPFAICCSVNEVIVHGFPSKEHILKEGDIVSVDMGVVAGGFHGDSARTFAVGNISQDARRLMDVTKESLDRGIAQALSGKNLYEISAAVQDCVEKAGFGVVRRFVGHGIGVKLHEKPEIPNFVPKGLSGVTLRPGMVLAIEPMVTEGSYDVEVLEDRWTAVTKDRKLAAHFEHTVAVTADGPLILTRSG